MSESNRSTNSEPANRFQDLAGREWVLELNRGKMLTIRNQLNVDFGDVEHFGKTWAQLLGDEDLLVEVVWIALSDKVGELTIDEFQNSLDGAIVEAAKDALLEAVHFFTQPGKRALIRKATAALMTAYRLAIAEAETRIERAMDEATTRASSRLGMSATKSRASSATSTTAGRSARRKSR